MNQLVTDIRNRGLMQGRKGVVVGAGRSGHAAAALLSALGMQVTLADVNKSTDPACVEGLENVTLALGPHSREQFTGAEVVVLSPGVPKSRLLDVLQDVPDRKIVGEMELASWFTDEPILAITGTNGKTTTTTLISEIIKHSGRTVFTGGNIGVPLCEHLLAEERADVLVLEVSSFQLQNVRLFKPRVGVLLNFAPNHLDYHKDLEEYLTAKLNLFARMDSSGAAILPEEMRAMLADRNFTRAEQHWFTPTNQFNALFLPGEHNKSNIAAAWLAVQQLGINERQAAEAIATFHPLPHRLQPVAEVKGVTFVDDSKATTLDAVAAALRSFDKPIRLLLGGVFKGGDVETELLPAMENVVQVGLFGAGREIFEPVLQERFPLSWDETLDGAVNRLFSDAQPDDVILLSPGTASFDLYGSYGERGDHFKSIAEGLK